MILTLLLHWTSGLCAIPVYFETRSNLPLVNISVAIRAGAALDTAEFSGLSDIMSKMLLRGTQVRTKAQIDGELDLIGGTIDSDTSYDSIFLSGHVLARNLDRYLLVLEEILLQPNFSQYEFSKLIKQREAEIRHIWESDPHVANFFYKKTLFFQHPYGVPIEGTLESIKNMKISHLQALYEKIVRAELMLIAGSGDATSERIEKFARIIQKKRPGGDLPKSYFAPIDFHMRKLVVINKPNITQIPIRIGQIGVRYDDGFRVPLEIINHAFGGGPHSRLFEEFRERRGMSYESHSFFEYSDKPRSWTISISPSINQVAEGMKLVIKMAESLQSHGLTLEEYELSKSALLNRTGFAYDTPAKRVYNALVEALYRLPQGFFRDEESRIQKLEFSAVNRVAREYFRPSRLTIVAVGPASKIKDALMKAADVHPSHVSVLPFDGK